MKEKNLRLLGQVESPNRQPSIQEIMSDLQEEIARGEAVYSKDELCLLERKLADYQQLWRSLVHG